MPNGDGKHEPREGDPDKLAQLLQIELIQNRARWQQAKARRGNLRVMSFLFLFVVIVAALAVFFIYLSPERVDDIRSSARNGSAAPANPTPK